jgi:hypothetical protein
VPGIDFNESYAPVINDVSFRIILIGMIAWNLKAKIIDIEIAFLHGELRGKNFHGCFMEIPSGIEVGDGKFLVLKKTIYGLVQDARQIHVKFVKALKSCGFIGSLADRCLWVKQSNTGTFMIVIYVDNWLTIGSDEGIK